MPGWELSLPPSTKHIIQRPHYREKASFCVRQGDIEEVSGSRSHFPHTGSLKIIGTYINHKKDLVNLEKILISLLHVCRISQIKYNITRAENTKERKDRSDSDVNELLRFKFKFISCQKLQRVRLRTRISLTVWVISLFFIKGIMTYVYVLFVNYEVWICFTW